MLALLADADFRRVWLIGGLTGGLRWLELLAVGVYVLEQTGSPSMVAWMTVARLAPMFLCGLPAGALADRYERRTLLLLGLAVLMLVSLVLGALALTGRITLWQIALGAFLNGVFFAADYPVRRIMTGEIAGIDRLGQAMALDSATGNATRMLGPALGGLLLETVGLQGAYLLGAGLYLVSIVLILRLRSRSTRFEGRGGGILTRLREGWSFVRNSRVIVGALMVTLVVNFWGFAYITMVPVIGERVLQLSAFPIGLLMSIEGLGALLGALVIGPFIRPRTYTRVYLLSSFVFLLAVLAFALSAVFPLSLALNLICGFSLAGFSVMQVTITFLAARPEVRSRVMGVLTVCIGAGPLGMLHLGWLADALGAAAAVQIMAIEGLVALALTAVVWPEMWRATELAPAPVDAADTRG
ncbi:MAG TPA: MFS transporter [Geminicoccaceae bacterium]|nr:MFS transporter [Geminicoccaceae bacterium]